MSRSIIIAAIIAAGGLGGTANSQDKHVSPAGVVQGVVFLAPACPGPAQIDRPECVKRPVQATVKVFAAGARNGNGATEPLRAVATDIRGRFRITLPSGTYRLLPVTSSGISRGKPADIAVTVGSTIVVELLIDSGMR